MLSSKVSEWVAHNPDVIKLVPLLNLGKEVIDIPKKVWSRAYSDRRKVQKPVVQKVCFVLHFQKFFVWDIESTKVS